MKSHHICSRHLCQLPGLNFNLVLLESVAHCVVFPIAPIHAYLICWAFNLRGECGDESSFPLGHASSFCEAVRALPALDLVRMPPFPPRLLAGVLFITSFFTMQGKHPNTAKSIHLLLLLSPVLTGGILCYRSLYVLPDSLLPHIAKTQTVAEHTWEFAACLFTQKYIYWC